MTKRPTQENKLDNSFIGNMADVIMNWEYLNIHSVLIYYNKDTQMKFVLKLIE